VGHPGSAGTVSLAGLVRVDLKRAAARAAEEVVRGADPGGMVSPFLAREGGADALSAALSRKSLPADAAKLALRAMIAAGRSDKALWELLHKAAGIVPGAPPYDAARIKALAAEVAAKGDPARGERVFRGSLTNCMACHSLGGAGGNVGPDLSAVGTALPVDMLIEAVLWPQKQVKEGFFSLLVATKGGDVYQGYRVFQDKQALSIRDLELDQVRRIPVDQIQATKDMGSNMPEGLAASLTEAELRDLISFLSQLGRPGPFRVDDAPVVRRWRVSAARSSERPPDDSPQWTARYGTAGGALPIEDFPPGPAVLWARFEVDVAAAGKVRLRAEPAGGLGEVGDRDLSAGRHSIVISIDRAARGDAPLRLQVEPAPGSPAQFRLVGGK
jgi:putative heme-binding domain-containing protein